MSLSLTALRVRRSFAVRSDRALVEPDGSLIVHPWLDLERNEFRPPFYTRMCLGVREAERARRRRTRGLHG